MPNYNPGGDTGSSDATGTGRGHDNRNEWYGDLSVNEPKFDPNVFKRGYNIKKGLGGFFTAGPLGLGAGIEPFNDQGQMTEEDWGMVNSMGDGMGNASGGADEGGNGGGGVGQGVPGMLNSAPVDPNSQSALIQQMIDANRVNQTTPFGGTTWDDDSVETYLTPELQSLFDKQFNPSAYDQYGDDYMANVKGYLDPIYAQQAEDLEQVMANRGQPVGGEEYTDRHRMMMDAQNQGWQNAAFGAKEAGETARLNDYNRLLSAMGKSSVGVPQVDVLGAANLGMNQRNIDYQRDQNDSDNIWNTLATLGGAYINTKPDWMFG